LYDDMYTWCFILLWMTVEMIYLDVDVMMFYSAAMFEKIIDACLVNY